METRARKGMMDVCMCMIEVCRSRQNQPQPPGAPRSNYFGMVNKNTRLPSEAPNKPKSCRGKFMKTPPAPLVSRSGKAKAWAVENGAVIKKKKSDM